MGKIYDIVLMSKNSHKGMISNVVEPLKEPTGYIIGSLGRRSHIFTVRPIQTAKRKLYEVSHGNNAAVRRLRFLEGVWENSGAYIGGFHAHIVKNGNSVENVLSKEDLDEISGQMKEMKKDLWIEVLLKLEERKFEIGQEIGETVRTRGKKLDCRIIDRPNHGYNITFSAYLINNNLKIKPLTIRDEKIAKIKRLGHYEGFYKHS